MEQVISINTIHSFVSSVYITTWWYYIGERVLTIQLSYWKNRSSIENLNFHISPYRKFPDYDDSSDRLQDRDIYFSWQLFFLRRSSWRYLLNKIMFSHSHLNSPARYLPK